MNKSPHTKSSSDSGSRSGVSHLGGPNPLGSLWFAIGFLTILPVPKNRDYSGVTLSSACQWFPLVGWLIGGLLWLLAVVIGSLPMGVGAVLLLGGWLLLTGMLHFDGLLDCADALLVPVSVERRLAILKDVHVGAFGVGVGGLALLLKWQVLSAVLMEQSIFGNGLVGLLFVPVLARSAVLWPIVRYPAARLDGMGAAVQRGGLVLPILCALPALLFAPFTGGAVLFTMVVGSWWAAKRLNGGLTGDVYGALIECAEIVGVLKKHSFI